MTNSKQTKRALVSSALAFALCFTMLLGTTFAWFTDNASTSVSKIQAGRLDIALQDGNGTSVESATLKWQKAAGHENEAVLWEPGASYSLQPVTIKNTGNLALKYQVEITGIDGDAKLNEVIEWSQSMEGATPVSVPSTSAAVGSEDMTSVIEYFLLPDESATLNVSGTMSTEAGNEYQGLSIDGVTITVRATQYTYEYDSNNNTYDANATYDASVDVYSLTNIKDAIANGKSNINIAGNFTVNTADNDGWSAIRVDGSGKNVTIGGNGTVTSNKFCIWSRDGAEVTINGGNFVTTTNTHVVYANLGAKVVINGGKFSISDTNTEPIFNVANYDGTYPSIIIKGGIYSKDPRTQIARNDTWNPETGFGIKIEDGYTVQTTSIDGVNWYQVVPE